MRAVRKDLLRNEVALRVNRNLAAGYPNRVARRYTAALHLDCAAAERNALAYQVVLAVGGQQRLRGWFIGLHEASRCCFVIEPKRPRIRFVVIALRVIGAKQVLEFARRALENFHRRLPFREPGVIDWNDYERRSLQ